MRYISTRGEGIEKKSAQAIIQGLAGDKGLFVPVDIPKISLNPDQLKGKSYQEIAKVVLKLFFDDFSDEEIAYCVENAYDEKFEDSEIAPIKMWETWIYLNCSTERRLHSRIWHCLYCRICSRLP